jgi:thioredoxin-related protein
MKHQFLLSLSVCALLYVRGDSGLPIRDSARVCVQFDNSRWQQILKKAKKEKKYIFVDCYTTWCSPCKVMDKEVYTRPEVGNYLNSHFISVEMQMDKTPNDDENTRSRYPDADLIQEQEGIPGYPAFFIFSPDGKLISRGMGLKYPDDFLGFVSAAIDPKAEHPYAKYYNLLSEFQKGKRDYTSMTLLLDTATLLGQTEISDSIQKIYSAYLKAQSDDQLYNQQIIGYLALRVQSSSSRYFHLFHPNEEKINELMGKHGYAQLVVGRVITNEYITPSIPAVAEPDWRGIMKTITDKYDSSYAEENILKARAVWYGQHHDQANQLKYFTIYINKYSSNLDANGEECAGFMDCDLNTGCWMVFKYSVDKDQIDASIKCMKGVLERFRNRGTGYVPGGFIDTYANLLYKAGRTNEAIEQEEYVLKYLINAKATENDLKEYKSTLERMKQGKPTWPHYISKDDFFGMGLI